MQSPAGKATSLQLLPENLFGGLGGLCDALKGIEKGSPGFLPPLRPSLVWRHGRGLGDRKGGRGLRIAELQWNGRGAEG